LFALPYWGGVSRRLHWTILGIALGVGVAIGAVIAIAQSSDSPASPVSMGPEVASHNPQLDPGTRLSVVAPGFTLTDQFGKRVSLRSYRGKVVVLSFNDPECTTICPLTTTALLHAKALLGSAASHVQLLGVGANPEATQVKWVHDYSQVHGMLHKWRFLTGSLPELRRVWHAYGIEAAVINDAIDHTPATYVIDTRGRLSRLYMAQMAYSSVSQLGYELAQSISALLPGHPALSGGASLTAPTLYGPRRAVTMPRAGGGAVRLGPGTGPHLLLFFDTWDSEVMNLRAGLEDLERYAAQGAGPGHPPLVAIDEATVEPSPGALPHFLAGLGRRLAYPVAIDRTGQVADGYRAQDSPWLALVSGSGRFLFYEDLAVKGWPTLQELRAKVHAALARAK
jgi:cytochrome oxidase Cu insertion factor (SCO1/SenC/PrrC family)